MATKDETIDRVLASVSTDYHAKALEIAALVAEKQIAYGDSFGKSGAVMAILYPGGIPLEKIDDARTIVRVIDKLFRIATDRDALGESPWRDVMGYALLASVRGDRGRATHDVEIVSIADALLKP
jgi:hypothetical protein